jgi:hypothetical protein
MALELYNLKGNRSFNFSIFWRELRVLDQHLKFQTRNYIHKFETSIPYSQIAAIYITEGIFFSKIEILSSGLVEKKDIRGEILIKFVPKRGAQITKFLIEEKMREFQGQGKPGDREHLQKIEKYIKHLNDNYKEKKISKKEMLERRERFLNKVIKNRGRI